MRVFRPEDRTKAQEIFRDQAACAGVGQGKTELVKYPMEMLRSLVSKKERPMGGPEGRLVVPCRGERPRDSRRI